MTTCVGKHRFRLVRGWLSEHYPSAMFPRLGPREYLFKCRNCDCTVATDSESFWNWQKPRLRFRWGPTACIQWTYEYNGSDDADQTI